MSTASRTIAAVPPAEAEARRPASRRCTHCGGNIFLTPDEDGGAQWACLQCGRGYPVTEVLAQTPAGSGRKAA